MEPVAPNVDSSLYDYMLWSHRRLEEKYCRLLEAIEVNSPEVRDLWTELERGLLSHMEAEERFVLPAFARVDREEAMALIRDHGRLREHLLEFGVEIDLHAVRYERARAAIDALRAHARREETLLYQWADKQLEAKLARAAIEHASTR